MNLNGKILLMMKNATAKQTTHFKGDAAEYTGNVLTIHGGTFYEVVMIEGIHKGQIKVVTNAPQQEGR